MTYHVNCGIPPLRFFRSASSCVPHPSNAGTFVMRHHLTSRDSESTVFFYNLSGQRGPKIATYSWLFLFCSLFKRQYGPLAFTIVYHLNRRTLARTPLAYHSNKYTESYPVLSCMIRRRETVFNPGYNHNPRVLINRSILPVSDRLELPPCGCDRGGEG